MPPSPAAPVLVLVAVAFFSLSIISVRNLSDAFCASFAHPISSAIGPPSFGAWKAPWSCIPVYAYVPGSALVALSLGANPTVAVLTLLASNVWCSVAEAAAAASCVCCGIVNVCRMDILFWNCLAFSLFLLRYRKKGLVELRLCSRLFWHGLDSLPDDLTSYYVVL